MRLELFSVGTNNYTVIVDGRFADGLTVDEALGVVASALFGTGEPLYVKTYEQWDAEGRRLRWKGWKEPAAMLAGPPG